MAVYDRWHKSGPGEPCRAHKAVPSAAHGHGRRWQVRWYDEAGRQRKRSFRLKEGRDPERHADAWDAKVTLDPELPGDADITLQEYAEDWRKLRSHDTGTAQGLERRLRLHVYPDPRTPGRTPKGGVAIGQRKMRELSRRPSLLQAWITAMPLAPSSVRVVLGDVSAVFRAAVDDGVVARDPVRSRSLTRPPRAKAKARPWSRAQVEAMRDALPGRYSVIADLGAGTGMRQGEMLGLAVGDITFLGRDAHVSVVRQVKLVSGRPHFAPLKNRKPHRAPLARSLAERLARHLELFPAAEVTLPWHDLQDPRLHGTPVTVRLVITDARGRLVIRNTFDRNVWHPALAKAGIAPMGPAREHGCHVLRHTAASAWLRAGIDLARVAAWLGDSPQVVLATYAHLMPGDDDEDGRTAIDAFYGPSGAPDMPGQARG